MIDSVYARLEKLEKKKNQLTDEIATIKPGESPQMAATVNAMKNMRRAFGAGKREDIREIMHQCIERIEARFDSYPQGKKIRCEFTGGTVTTKRLVDVLGVQLPKLRI